VAAGARTAGISAALQARPPGRPPLSGSLIGCAASAPARGCHGDGVGRQMARQQQQQQQPGHDTGRQVGLSTRNADESCDDMSSLARPNASLAAAAAVELTILDGPHQLQRAVVMRFSVDLARYDDTLR